MEITGVPQGVLGAVSFDQGMQTVEEKVLSEFNLQACTALRRIPKTDDLVVGCFKHMLIVSWEGRFVVRNLIENVHSSKSSRLI